MSTAPLHVDRDEGWWGRDWLKVGRGEEQTGRDGGRVLIEETAVYA